MPEAIALKSGEWLTHCPLKKYPCWARVFFTARECIDAGTMFQSGTLYEQPNPFRLAYIEAKQWGREQDLTAMERAKEGITRGK